MIDDDFGKARNQYERLGAAIQPLLEQLAQQSGVSLVRIESRIKSEESLREKLNRPKKKAKYSNLEDVTDLCGLRIIVHSITDCEKIIREIREHFVIDEMNSLDKGALQDPDRFGYLSTHLIVSISDERSNLFEYAGLGGLKAEIQVRTALQHAWALLDWEMKYKSKVEVPRELQRKLFRISALLETADDAFSELKKAAEELRAGYDNDVRSGKLGIPINRDSLSAFIRNSKIVEDVFERCRAAGIPITQNIAERLDATNNKPWTYLINSLIACNISTLEDFEGELLQVREEHIAALKSVHSVWRGGKGTFGIFSPLRILMIAKKPVGERVRILDEVAAGSELGTAERSKLVSTLS
jgi:putative GTP pyrophosphokinase